MSLDGGGEPYSTTFNIHVDTAAAKAVVEACGSSWATGDPPALVNGIYTPTTSAPILPNANPGSLARPLSSPSVLTQIGDPFAVGSPLGPEPCAEHQLDPEHLSIEEDGIKGFCIRCEDRMVVPRVPGGISFDKAGNLVGRAMTIEDEDSLGELLAELNLFERDVNKEIAKYKRTLGLVKIARDIVQNRALEEAQEPIE